MAAPVRLPGEVPGEERPGPVQRAVAGRGGERPAVVGDVQLQAPLVGAPGPGRRGVRAGGPGALELEAAELEQLAPEVQRQPARVAQSGAAAPPADRELSAEVGQCRPGHLRRDAERLVVRPGERGQCDEQQGGEALAAGRPGGPVAVQPGRSPERSDGLGLGVQHLLEKRPQAPVAVQSDPGRQQAVHVLERHREPQQRLDQVLVRRQPRELREL